MSNLDRAKGAASGPTLPQRLDKYFQYVDDSFGVDYTAQGVREAVEAVSFGTLANAVKITGTPFMVIVHPILRFAEEVDRILGD